MTEIRIDGSWFKDTHGRTRHLRGVNLGGSSKVPTIPDGSTHIREGFLDNPAGVSFVGRPFPLEEADEHFRRLRHWGLTFIRLTITWEAIEHTGPGQYDTDYLDYLTEIVRKAGEHDMLVFIDPHQDVWSRFSGGDGAPAWTLEKVGFDLTQFESTGAAIVHQLHGDPFPRMIWPSNYNKLAAATMFTLFFAGNDFAPKTLIDGEPAQDYLQRHYINAIAQVAERLKDMPHVIGYDTMNEPSRGYIGHENLYHIETQVLVGDIPSPFQSMLLGMGHAESVGHYELTLLGPRLKFTRVINPQGCRVWRDGYDCVWRQNGVWDYDANGVPRLLEPDYFTHVNGEIIDFAHHYLKPFANRFAQAIQAIDPDAMIFFEIEAIDSDMPPYWTNDDAPNLVYAPHWYDGVTLFTKRYIPWVAYDPHAGRPIIGRNNVRKWQADQIARFKRHAKKYLGDVPVIIGETGIPYDMNNNEAFVTGDYRVQIQAANDYLSAMEQNLVGFTIWNYTSDNSNKRGDLWNGENLSIFSREQQTNPADINSGGRALESVIRPYAIATAGEPLRSTFDYHSGIYEFTFRHDPNISEPTEFYIPHLQYPHGYVMETSDGEFERDEVNQRLYYRHSGKDIPHFVRILPLVPRTDPVAEPPLFNRILIIILLLIALRQVASLFTGKKRH